VQHAEHFLSRLDRLPRSEVDLALDLYRDPELVRRVLGEASLPEQAGRVAISIDDPTLGPFIIVTREGRFVTCLGRGMRPGEHPVVTRSELDRIARQVEGLREKLALKEQLRGKESPQSRLLRRLCVATDSVSREEFLAVAEWAPLLGQMFLETYLHMAVELLKHGPILRRVQIRGPKAEGYLHAYWTVLHSAGHMALLASMTDEKDTVAPTCERFIGRGAGFSQALTWTGVLRFIAQGAWAAGRLGKVMLPEFKRTIVESTEPFEVIDALFALLAIGTRTTGARAEILKALHAAPTGARTPAAAAMWQKHGTYLDWMCKNVVTYLGPHAETVAGDMRRFGEQYFDEDDPFVPGDPEAEEWMRTLPLTSLDDGVSDIPKVQWAFVFVAAAARGGPERFYLPTELARAQRTPWTPADTWGVLSPTMSLEKRAKRTVVREATVERNAPCPCGSGRKWKKCCGAR
jgi:hypothetical protein